MNRQNHPQGAAVSWIAAVAVLTMTACLIALLAFIREDDRLTATQQSTTLRTNVVVPGPIAPPATVPSGLYPATPAATGANVCAGGAQASLLISPYHSGNTPTLGSTTNVVTLTPANYGSTALNTANTTYYYTPGSYSGAGPEMGTNDWYVGEYSAGTGATVNGGGAQYGFETQQAAPADFVEYLTIENYATAAVGFGYNNVAPFPEGAPGNLTIKYNTIENNIPGNAIQAGSFDVIEYNCLTGNGDYGIQTFCQVPSLNVGGCVTHSAVTQGPIDITVEFNEVAYNNQCNYEAVPAAYFPITSPAGCSGAGQFFGCGCAAGMHFWATDGTKVIGNYIHDNYDISVWWDTENNAEFFSGNYLSNSFNYGISIEIGYNALITDNNFVDNAWGAGGCPTCGLAGNLAAAIYDSESGGTGSAIGQASWPTGTAITGFVVQGNNFQDNWGGILSFDYPDRFAGSPDNTSTGWGTLGIPITNFTSFWDGVAGDTPSTPFYANEAATGGGCGQANLTGAVPGASPDYWQNCWWKVSNVSVTGNSFELNASVIHGDGSSGSTVTCTTTSTVYCGMNAFVQDFGSLSWSPWFTFDGGFGMWAEMNNCIGPDTFSGCVSLNNSFTNNTYTHTGSQAWRFLYRDYATETASQWQALGWDAGSTFS